VKGLKTLTKKDDRLAIEVYVDTCKDLLGLKDWKIVYKVCEEPAKEAEADISCAHGKIAYLRLNKSFFTFSPEYQRNVICHELVHMHLFAVDDCFMSTRECLGGAAYSVLDNLFTEASENATQTFSHLLEGLLPLPKFA
jgi:hypothetical protein